MSILSQLDRLPDKYYTISQVAEMFRVNTSLIRYWEKEFKGFNPSRSNSGHRRFVKKDIERFAKIYELVKIKGFTLEGARHELSTQRAGGEAPVVIAQTESGPNAEERRAALDKLERIKQQLLEWEAGLSV